MTTRPNVREDRETLSVQIPLQFPRRGGRKLMVAPEGATAWAPQRARIDSAIVKALARAHRWRRMLESGEYASVTELAAAEKINQSYLCRVLRLTLLAPSIVEAILDRRQRGGVDLVMLMKPFPVHWRKQCDAFGLITEGQRFKSSPRNQITPPSQRLGGVAVFALMFGTGVWKHCGWTGCSLEAENLFLRHQLNIALRRRPARFPLRGSDRALLVWMTRLWPSLLSVVRVFDPATILRWQRRATIRMRMAAG